MNEVMLEDYQSGLLSDWSFERVYEEESIYYRIRSVRTGLYLVPQRESRHSYYLSLSELEESYEYSFSLWRVVKNRNGSFSIVNRKLKMALSYSEHSFSHLVLKPFEHLSCQCFFFYNWNQCMNKMLGEREE